MRCASARLSERRTAELTVCVGAILGVLVSISSVGAGAIGVTALILLYPQLPTARIVGSDIAHAVPLTLVAGIGHWWLGSINLDLLVPLLLGSVPGIVLGSYTAARVPETALRLLLAGNADCGGDQTVARHLFRVRRRRNGDDEPRASLTDPCKRERPRRGIGQPVAVQIGAVGVEPRLGAVVVRAKRCTTRQNRGE